MKSRAYLVCAVAMALAQGGAVAAEYYVSPDGRGDARGTRKAPWDIVSVLAGKQPVKGGDTVWLAGGRYRCAEAYKTKGQGFRVSLSGTKDKPVVVRAVKGARAVIDGGLAVSASYLWLWDLEISQPADMPRVTKTGGSHPGDLGGPLGSLSINGGTGSRFINLLIRDNLGSGVNWWSRALGGEIYGCIIVNNGWKGPDRNHGHCIYTQNKTGTGIKTIANCIMSTRWPGGQCTMHAYGSSRAYVDDYVIEDNIAWRHGTFLVGGGRPSRNITARRNCLYKVPMQIGYNAPHNEDCQIADNVVFRSSLTVNRYKRGIVRGNLVVGGLSVTGDGQVVRKDNLVLKGRLPDRSRVVLLVNTYDPGRANLAVFNWKRAASVDVDVTGFLKPGDTFKLTDPLDFHGKPVVESTCRGKTITVPTPGEFAVFVVLKTGE